MPKFAVTVPVSGFLIVHVNAKSMERAEEKALHTTGWALVVEGASNIEVGDFKMHRELSDGYGNEPLCDQMSAQLE